MGKWAFGVVVVVACVVSMSAAVATGTGVPHLQLRPVLTELPPATVPATAVDPASRAAVASCDASAVAVLGRSVATTAPNRANPRECVVLRVSDGPGTRHFLGPSALDATDVKKATAHFAPGSGWALQLSLTHGGAKALDALAQQQFHDKVALVANGEVVVAPLVQPSNATFESFDGQIVTSGLTEGEAKGLAHSIAKWKSSG
jgi:preprotein translocase subunit SecD